jgi:hypothetical protein
LALFPVAVKRGVCLDACRRGLRLARWLGQDGLDRPTRSIDFLVFAYLFEFVLCDMTVRMYPV